MRGNTGNGTRNAVGLSPQSRRICRKCLESDPLDLGEGAPQIHHYHHVGLSLFEGAAFQVGLKGSRKEIKVS